VEKRAPGTIGDLLAAQRAGRISAADATRRYLKRIADADGEYNAVIETNPDAVTIAEQLDRERRSGRERGSLHGIPVLIKDNLDTGDRMQTTAGSLALAGTRAARDSTVAARLRAAGAVILGKTNLSEWANFRSSRSSSGWSSRGGQTRNALDPTRTPGGSSSGSGVAVALEFCAAAIGTETDGSIVGPAALNGVVGIKPTVGLVRCSGIIPVAASQDTAGPMGRCVADAAVLLGAIAGHDPRDAASRSAERRACDYTRHLDAEALRGARIGVARAYCGYHERVDALFERALATMGDAGAVIVDPVDLPAPDELRPHEILLMEHEFKAGINAYLANRADNNGLDDLDDLIAFNVAHADSVMPYFGQDIFIRATGRDPLDAPEYIRARAEALRLARDEGLDRVLASHALDAIVAATRSPAWKIDWMLGDHSLMSAACLPAVAGYPHLTVPMGRIDTVPVGLSFMSGAWREPRLIALAYAYERRASR